MIDYQFELEGILFGLFNPGGVEVEANGWNVGALTYTTQDAQGVNGDYTSFGTDHIIPPIWQFGMFTNCDSAVAANTAAAELYSAWVPAIPLGPGEALPLKYRLYGRTRRVYGRPRNWSAPINNLSLTGRIDITAEFKLSSPVSFDDTEESVAFELSASTSGGGLASPLVSPLTSIVGATPPERAVIIGGTRPTPMLAVIEGSGTNLRFVVGGRVIQISGTTEPADEITVDARPWSRSVVGGRVSPETRLSQLWLPPGTHSVDFTSTAGGTATATLYWRKAYHYL